LQPLEKQFLPQSGNLLSTQNQRIHCGDSHGYEPLWLAKGPARTSAIELHGSNIESVSRPSFSRQRLAALFSGVKPRLTLTLRAG
jgi:hypothetical protein